MSFVVNSDTRITVTAPAGIAGTVDVTVVTAVGTSVAAAADQFTYAAVPTVGGISPSAGPITGGTMVTITGTGLANATAVYFGATLATIVPGSNTGSQLVVASPAGVAGMVDVTVTTTGGTSTATTRRSLYLCNGAGSGRRQSHAGPGQRRHFGDH